MRRIVKLVVTCVVVVGALGAPGLHAQGLAGAPPFRSDYVFADTAQCLHSASANCRRKPRAPAQSSGDASAIDTGGPVVRVRGDAGAMRLELRRTTIADALSALRAFDVSYRSTIVLDEEINGTYAGSLRRVIAHVLDGYNYVIKQDGASVDVVIFGRRGERATAVAPLLDPFHPGRERRRPQLTGPDHP